MADKTGAAAQTVEQQALADTNQLAQAAPSKPAAAKDSDGLAEIIVTAQRRAQNIQNVPLAVSSFSPIELESKQITSTLDIAKYVPNFISSNNVGQASANVYYIRGLGQTQSFPTFEPQVSTYVDDIYIGRQNANNFGLFDVEQVQVLRGPQGTLFGRNSTAGAVVVTLAKPSTQFTGYIEGGYGADNRFFGRGSVDMPVSDQILTKTSFFGDRDDGYVNNLTTGDKLNGKGNWGVREAIRLLPHSMENLTWDISVDYANNDQANGLNLPLTPGGQRVSYSGLAAGGGGFTPFLVGDKATLGQGVLVKSWGAMSNLQYKTDAGTANLISGFRGVHQSLGMDFPFSAFGPLVPYDSSSPVGQFGLAQSLSSWEFSQELKWNGEIGDRINYTLGLYYLYELNKDSFGEVANLGILFGLKSLPFPLADEFTSNETDSKAAYAQGDYKLTDALTATVGLRYTYETKDVSTNPEHPGVVGGFTTAQVQALGYKTDLSSSVLTPRVALQYQVMPELMTFASITRGFQGGGWNGLSSNAASFNNFGPETVLSYETGFRYETSDKRLRLNTTAFYEDVHDYQLLATNTAAGAGNFTTNNAADMQAYGLEAELTVKPIDKLTLTATAGLMDAFYNKPSVATAAQQASCRAGNAANCGQGIVDPTGKLAMPSQVPPVTMSFYGSYSFQLSGFSLLPSAGIQYVGRQQLDTAGRAPGYDPTHYTVDLGVTLQPDELPISFTAECKNCTMQDYGTTYLFGYKYYNAPGIWDIRARYAF